jgi:hypothetical protein
VFVFCVVVALTPLTGYCVALFVLVSPIVQKETEEEEGGKEVPRHSKKANCWKRKAHFSLPLSVVFLATTDLLLHC